MKNCLIYIFIIFIISFFLSKILTNNVKEGLSNNILEKITLEDIQKDINPSLAGSIDFPKNEKIQDFKIYDEDKYYNLMKRNIAFQDYKKIDKSSNAVNYGKFFDERITDYAPYENILPPMKFKKHNKIQDLTNVPVIQNNITNDQDNSERIYGLDGLNPENDCQGKWEAWDESNCPDSRDRCSIKSRVYKVLKVKGEGGKDCSYEGNIIEDGDVEYDYCFGSGHLDRCGLERNLCQCDLDNYDEDDCDLDTMDDECRCPAGYTLSNSSGICVSGSGADVNPLPIDLTQEEVDRLRILLNSSGALPTETRVVTETNPVTDLNIFSLLRLSYAESELETARNIESRLSGSGLTEEQRQRFIEAEGEIIEDIIESEELSRQRATERENQ